MLDVYRTYYRLTGEPFRLSPDHRFSLGHRSYANAKAYLDYALLQGEGFIAITGGPGTGKTTLINDILAGFEQTEMRVATLTSTQLESRDLLHMVAHSFDLHPDDRSKANLLLELERFLNQQSYRGHHTILIVDEAQSLSPSALEELRLLANMQRKDQLLLQIFLVGQEKLLDLIRAPGMEQLQQRLVATSVLEPLDLDETIDYVEHRLCRVAWRGDPAINEDALRLIYKYSGGIPRRINMICNRLFLYGGMQEKHELVGEDARTVIDELRQEFLLPSKAPGEGGDGEGKHVESSTDGAETPVRSLPRGERIAESPSTPSGLPPSPAQGPQRHANDGTPRSWSGRAQTTRPRVGKEGRDSTFTVHAEHRPDRGAKGLHSQPVGRPNSLRAERASAIKSGFRQRTGKHRGIVAAGLFLLAGVLLAVIMTETDLEGLLQTVGLVEPHDTFNPTLQTTGVHKAVKVFPVSEEPVTPESQSTQPGQAESSRAEVLPDVSQQDPATASATTNVPSSPASPAEVAQAAKDTAASEATSSVSTEGEKESIIHGEKTDTENSGEGLELPSALPSTAVKTVMTDDDVESADDDGASAAAVEAEHGKLRRVARERFSQHRIQPKSEAGKVAPSPTTPAAPPRRASDSISNASQSTPSTANGSAPKGSTPKSSAVKLSTPKVSEPKALAPKASTPKVSESIALTPRASAPKASAPKVSQPKITVARATSATTPERGSGKGGRSLKQIRSSLLEGQWTSRGKPASLLPSEITFCNSQGEERIGCWSVPQNINTKYGPALYKVETSLKGFSAGSFKLSYRTLVKLVDAGATDGAKEKAASSPEGWQLTEHSMQCQLTDPDTVLCRDKKGVTRDYRRSK